MIGAGVHLYTYICVCVCMTFEWHFSGWLTFSNTRGRLLVEFKTSSTTATPICSDRLLPENN